ncbi:MAG: hypothetical protein EOO92_18920 [Pedobacter sp.]|nr:MAG: hypothetical protein EOO92_18920 [Pedobacter sp.]
MAIAHGVSSKTGSNALKEAMMDIIKANKLEENFIFQGWTDNISRDWKYNMSANAAFNRNRVVALAGTVLR